MVWTKRRFEGVDYVPYMDLIEKLVMANATRYAEFIMVSVKVGKGLVDDYYVGLPDDTFLRLFDGFERVPEDALPKVIDTCLYADQTKEPWVSRGFTFRHNLRS